MTRVVDFSDGFVSASPPVSQTLVDVFDIDNDDSGNLTLFDETIATSAIVDYELERSDSFGDFRQVGRFICYYDGSDWQIGFGMYSGDNLINDPLASPQDVTISISVGGQLSYLSNEMTGTGYSGSIKLAITRFKA
jgi:hypothetical protein